MAPREEEEKVGGGKKLTGTRPLKLQKKKKPAKEEKGQKKGKECD